MRNIKEIKPILASIYCINLLSNKDEDIDKILKYAFARILNSNTNLLTLACIGKSKDQIMPEILQLLHEETRFIKDNK